MAEGVKYIKVAKIDGDGIDQTSTLQFLTKLTIPYSTGNVTYDILSISEQPTYVLYSVNNPNIEHTDAANLNYSFSGSYTGSYSQLIYSPQITSSVDTVLNCSNNLGFFLNGGSSNGGLGSNGFPIDSYKIDTYIQKNIHVRTSSSIRFVIEDSKASTTSVSASVRIVSSPLTIGSNPYSPTIHAESILTQSLQNVNTNPLQFTGSYDITAELNSGSISSGDCVYFEVRAAQDGGEFGGGIFIQDAIFTNGIFEISSSAASDSALEIIPEPFFTQNFSRAFDCQPTFNNVLSNRLSTQHQDIDYASGLLSPVNFTLLINGVALKAEVQDSNYTLLRHIRPRYEGSKNTTDNFNNSSISQSLIIESNENTYLGTSTISSPSVESLDSTIHEFSVGGGTYPEIQGGGSVLISQYLNVSSQDKDFVSILTPITDGFNSVLEQKFPPNSQPFITQYISTSENTEGARVLDTNLGIPPISNFIIPSSFPSARGTATNLNTLSISGFNFLVTKNIEGFYTSSIFAVGSNGPGPVISKGLDSGERWYITIYNTLPTPVKGALSVFNSGSEYDYTARNSNGDYDFPLTKNGVYEILSASFDVDEMDPVVLTITPELPESGSGGSLWEFGNNDKGYLIWKSNDSRNVVFNDATFSGVGKGNLITKNSTQVIKDNLIDISKTYGENT